MSAKRSKAPALFSGSTTDPKKLTPEARNALLRIGYEIQWKHSAQSEKWFKADAADIAVMDTCGGEYKWRLTLTPER